MKKIIFIILVGIIIQGCGSNPTEPENGQEKTLIYQYSGIDSIIGPDYQHIWILERELGELDFSNAGKLYINYNYKDSVVGWEIYVNLCINDSNYYTRYLENYTEGNYRAVTDSCFIPEYTGNTKFKITMWYSTGYGVIKNFKIYKK